ncbi:MAG: hypothetical protein JXR76_02520 [Deltaproteobacteria bacterium]|nr:hypothetical protein [Deltaproteobacteria bacterium]
MTTLPTGRMGPPSPPLHGARDRSKRLIFHPLPLGELDLTAEQEMKIFALMDENRSKVDASFDETFPRL